jgi:mRNA interferase RelE/StbE
VATFTVAVTPKAERQIKGLPAAEGRSVAKKLRALAENPRPRGAEKLSQAPCFWRIRVGNYRVVYVIDEPTMHVGIALVRHRKDAYRDLDKLDPAAVINFIHTLASLR